MTAGHRGTTEAILPSALTLPLARLARGKRVAVFLDYDGTLSPIVERPQDAAFPPGMRRTVRKLAARAPLAIVSGRDLADLKERVGVDGVWYAGSHGFDLTAPGGGETHLEEAMALVPQLDAAEALLADAARAIEGAWVERKRFALALHYRQTPSVDVAAVDRAVERALSRCPGLRDVPGKMVHDLRPAVNWDKGKAMLWLLARMAPRQGAGPGADDLLVFVGDDITDEDAFAAVDDRGLGIVVRTEPHPTKARYQLRDPDEVRQFLENLAEALRPPGS